MRRKWNANTGREWVSISGASAHSSWEKVAELTWDQSAGVYVEVEVEGTGNVRNIVKSLPLTFRVKAPSF